MNEKLPKVNTFPLTKKINNQKELFYGKEEVRKDNIPISIKINKIFNSPSYVYKKEVTVVTSTNTFNKTIIGKTSNYLLTKDNSKINIKDIIDIYEK